jgi:two-component system response regulator PilR (NtrC family)
MQVKLLRAIQERAIRPIGRQEEIHVDVRILSATHKNLVQEVEEGRFRQDLFYRINVIELTVPPLRQRINDLEPLTEFILAKIAKNYSLPVINIDASALSRLSEYTYPGNIRELENILERATTLCDSETISEDDIQLPANTQAAINREPDPAIDVDTSATLPKDQLEDYLVEKERKAIIAALEKTRWNKTAAAKLLGISFRQLRYRLKKLDLE